MFDLFNWKNNGFMHLTKVKSCFQVLLCWTEGSFKFLISKTSDKVFYENSSIRFVSSLILKITFSRIPCFNKMVIMVIMVKSFLREGGPGSSLQHFHSGSSHHQVFLREGGPGSSLQHFHSERGGS